MDESEDRNRGTRPPELRVGHGVRPQPADIAITRTEISTLVDTFYGHVWAHPRLSPIFSSRLDADRDKHLARMKQFWASVLLRSGEYHGRPVPKHKAITEAQSSDFAHWLDLFCTTAHEVLTPQTATHVVAKAEQIAQSLWLAMFGGVGDAPPIWLKGPDYLAKYAETETREIST